MPPAIEPHLEIKQKAMAEDLHSMTTCSGSHYTATVEELD